MTRLNWLLMAVVSGLAVGCSDHPPTAPPPPPAQPPAPPPPPPPPAPPGTTGVVALVTPNADDGAVQVTLRGPGISDLETASSGYVFYSRLSGDSVAHAIVIGDVSAGPIIKFKLASGSAITAYHATIDQVAARNNALRSSVGNYSLTLTSQ